MPEDKFSLGRVMTNFNSVKTTLPKVLANEARNFFLSSFDKQGWDNGMLQPWEQVKRREEGTPEYKYPAKKGLSRRTSPILIRTGALRRRVGMSIRVVSFQEIKLVVAEKYAAAQNEGSPEKHIPKRQFMGNSATLDFRIRQKINQHIDSIWTR